MKIFAILLMLVPLLARGEPSEIDLRNYRTKLAQFFGERMSKDKAMAELKGWFGRTFEARRDDATGQWDFFVLARNENGFIDYYQRIGTIEEKSPHQLMMETE